MKENKYVSILNAVTYYNLYRRTSRTAVATTAATTRTN